MARLLLGDQCFYQLSNTSLYEAEYERLLIAHGRGLFPEHYVLPFKPIVQSEVSSARPDLALVDREFRSWWVIEVELSHHSLHGHVLPQVSVLASGRYGQSEAHLLRTAIPDLALPTALDLVKGAQPGTLVIVNERRPTWEIELARVGVRLMVVEVFRSDHNSHALMASGFYPRTPADFVSDCTFDSILPGCLVVDSPVQLGVQQGKTLWIEVEGKVTEWTRFDVQDRVWLKPRGANPLERNRGRFRLFRHRGDRLLLDRAPDRREML